MCVRVSAAERRTQVPPSRLWSPLPGVRTYPAGTSAAGETREVETRGRGVTHQERLWPYRSVSVNGERGGGDVGGDAGGCCGSGGVANCGGKGGGGEGGGGEGGGGEGAGGEGVAGGGEGVGGGGEGGGGSSITAPPGSSGTCE